MFQIFMKWIVLVCALLLLFPANASAQEIKGHFSGSGFISAFDSNDDGVASSVSELTGNFSQFDKFTARARDESFPWDGVSWCSPTEIQLDGSSNDLCFDITNGSMQRTFLNQIIGGTGRFAGASGYLGELIGQDLYTPLDVLIGAVFEGECEGELE